MHQLDANAKFGKKIIPNDPHEISANGRLLLSLVERMNLVIVNSTMKCHGTITRMKKVKNNVEESVLEYFLVCQNFYLMINSMIIDEERKYVLTKYTKKKCNSFITESDHNPLIIDIDVFWNSKIKPDRTEIFNLRNAECQDSFFRHTNNSDILTKCLINKDVRSGGRLWLKNLKYIIQTNFKKIRITNQKTSNADAEISRLIEQRRIGDEPQNKLIEQKISQKIYEKNRSIILEQVGGMVDMSSNLSRPRMWKIKQKVCPKKDVSYPVAKIDSNGDLITNKSELKILYANTYKDRLRHREIKPEYQILKQLKNGLFSMRVNLAKLRKSESWTQADLFKVTKQLKTSKAADPKGLVSELFKPGVAGSDLFQSVLLLCNKVKDECQIPAFMEWTNISSIYKSKGVKTDLNNDRGVFNIITVRSIIDNLMYNDYYDLIDQNMSDSNVGGRRQRNIRDNLFIVYGVMNYALRENLEVDMGLYDLEKCFDSMWYEETMNDLWDAGIQDEKFALIGKLNEKCNIQGVH